MTELGQMTDEAEAIAIAAARAALDEYKRKQRWDAELELLLESDIALNDWLRRRNFGDPLPAVRASVYGNRCDYIQDKWSQYFGDDPRRPVIMRGATELMVARYARSTSRHCANGFVGEVIQRWFRRRRFTCFDHGSFAKEEKRIWQWIRRRNFRVSYHLRLEYWHLNRCWIDGEYRWLEPGERQRLQREHERRQRVTAKPKPLPSRKVLDREARALARALYDMGILKPGELA